MLTYPRLLSLTADGRVVRTKARDGVCAWGEWACGMKSADERGLFEYCAEVERMVRALYSEADRCVVDHEISLVNNSINGVTHVRVDWGDEARTLAVVAALLLDMRRGVREECFFSEEQVAEQRRIRARLAFDRSAAGLYAMDPVLETYTPVSESLRSMGTPSAEER